jgi:hypothetical protein
MAIGGPIWIRNELKSIEAAEPIRIFGGSTIRVAAPPIFDAKTWAKMNGIAGTFNVLVIDNVTGTISRIVVTLSMNMEAMAVKEHSNSINFHRFPLLNFPALIPTQ